MDQKRWKRIESILDKALKFDSVGQQIAFIKSVCKEDEKLCQETIGMIRSIQMAQDSGFLE